MAAAVLKPVGFALKPDTAVGADGFLSKIQPPM